MLQKHKDILRKIIKNNNYKDFLHNPEDADATIAKYIICKWPFAMCHPYLYNYISFVPKNIILNSLRENFCRILFVPKEVFRHSFSFFITCLTEIGFDQNEKYMAYLENGVIAYLYDIINFYEHEKIDRKYFYKIINNETISNLLEKEYEKHTPMHKSAKLIQIDLE